MSLETDELTGRQAIEATIWRILREAYLRPLRANLGPLPTLEDQHLALDPYLRSMEADLRALRLTLDQARAQDLELIGAFLDARLTEHVPPVGRAQILADMTHEVFDGDR